MEGDDETDKYNVNDGEGGGSGQTDGPGEAEDDRMDTMMNEPRANRPKAQKA